MSSVQFSQFGPSVQLPRVRVETNRSARVSCRTTGSRAVNFHVVCYAYRAALGLSYTGTPRVRYRLGIWRRLRAGQGELHGKPRRDSDRYSARLFIVRRVF